MLRRVRGREARDGLKGRNEGDQERVPWPPIRLRQPKFRPGTRTRPHLVPKRQQDDFASCGGDRADQRSSAGELGSNPPPSPPSTACRTQTDHDGARQAYPFLVTPGLLPLGLPGCQ